MPSYDIFTVQHYDLHAASICQHYRASTPHALYRVLGQYFHPAQPTADIGCGSGRDVAWLMAQGYPTIGYDASDAMLTEARAAYPGIVAHNASLPTLAGIADAHYANVLCSATLMHLPTAAVAPALVHLSRILQLGGRLVLTFRQSRAATEREADGRLFTPLTRHGLAPLLGAANLRVLHHEHQPDATRAGVQWVALVAERGNPNNPDHRPA